MQEEIAKLKYEKVSSKSLGQQLDGCKSAIERAQKRRLAAQQQLEEATKSIEKETMEIARLDGELKKVEIAIATQQEAAPGDPMECLMSTMKELLTSLQQPNATLDKDLVTNKIMEAISATNRSTSPVVQGMQAEAMSVDHQGTQPPPQPCATFGHRLRVKSGNCARTAPYNNPPQQSFAHPTTFSPLAQESQEDL